MESTIVAVIAAAVAVVGAATGIGTAVFNWRAQSHAIKRDQVAIDRDRADMERGRTSDYWAAYEKRIAILKELGDEPRMKETQRECEQTLQAWQETRDPPAPISRGAVTADEPTLSAEESEQVRAYMAASARVPTTLLSADDYFRQGRAYYRAGAYPQALEAYNRSLELKPDNLDALNNRGMTLDELKRYEEALKDYSHALELRPDFPEVLNNRGVALAKMERYDEGLKDYDRALELKPDYMSPLYNRACAYSLMSWFQESLRDLDAAIKGDEKYRQMARTDEDFEGLRNNPEYGPRFRELVGEQDQPEG